MQDYTYAIDISKWQGDWVSPQKTIDAGINFVYMRSSNGRVKDSKVDEYAAICKAYGINFGLYHFFRPKYDAKTQAEFLFKLHQELGANMVPQLDIEEADDLDARTVTDAVVVFIEEVERLFGKSALVYTGAWWWNPNIVPGAISVVDRVKWVARYMSRSEGPPTDVREWRAWAESFGRPPKLPEGWDDWGLWQFSADGNNKAKDLGFTSNHIDLNIVKPGVFEHLVIVPAVKPVSEFHDVARTGWELEGERIADKTNSGPVRQDRIESIVLHYPGTRTVNPDTVKGLQDSNRRYQQGRGYSYGYNWLVDQNGTCYEVRGWDYENAANRGANSRSVSIQIKTVWQDEASPAAVERVRKLIAAIRNRLGRDIPVIGHRDVAATQCPGEGIYRQLQAGTFDTTVEATEPVGLVWTKESHTVGRGDGPIRIVRAMSNGEGSWAAAAKLLWSHNGLRWVSARDYEMVHPGRVLWAPGVEPQPVAPEPEPARMLRRGSRGAEVVELQTLLAARGFYLARVDGKFGPVTERAVRSFQRSERIVVDGIVGPQTWGRLK